MKYAFTENKDVIQTPVLLQVHARRFSEARLNTASDTESLNKECAEGSLYALSWRRKASQEPAPTTLTKQIKHAHRSFKVMNGNV